MSTFILVHGTFATGADWPQLKEALATTSIARDDSAKFTEVKWSGRNSVSARGKAADDIGRTILAAQKMDPSEPIFVIGHSHGGSALAYLVKRRPDIARSVAGCAFLSTPFIAIRQRANAANTMLGLSFLPAMMLTFLVVTLFPRGNKIEFTNVWFWVETAATYGPWVMFAVLLLLLRQTESTLSNSLQGQTVLLPPSNYLFIRFAGDEAAAVLAAVQFASAVGSKLTRYLRVFYGSSTGPLSVARQVLRFSLTIIVIGFFTVVAWDRYSADASVRAAIAGLLPEKVIWLCVVMSGIFFVSATLGLAIFAFQAASAWAYGWTRFMEGFLVEFAIEPLPFGNYRLCSIDWNEEFPNLKSLYHSWSYAHPIAVGHIVDWVDRTLRDISAQNSEREM